MDYIKELDCTLQYIEKNLKTHLELEAIARQVNVSAYHFHRIFKAVIGETIMGHVRTRRLT